MCVDLWWLSLGLYPLPAAGVILRYQGAPPDAGDPFWCPFDPVTGKQLPRTVSMNLQCNPNVQGANLVKAIQNATEDCE